MAKSKSSSSKLKPQKIPKVASDVKKDLHIEHKSPSKEKAEKRRKDQGGSNSSAVSVKHSQNADKDAPKNGMDVCSEEQLLSAELMEQLGGDASTLIQSAKKRKRSDGAERIAKPHDKDNMKEAVAVAVHMSKAKKKKLLQIAQKKVKEEQRGVLYSQLEGNQLTASQLQLIQHSGDLGKKLSLKERIRRTLQRANAGIKPSASDEHEFELHTSTVQELEDELGMPPGGAWLAIRRSKGEIIQEDTAQLNKKKRQRTNTSNTAETSKHVVRNVTDIQQHEHEKDNLGYSSDNDDEDTTNSSQNNYVVDGKIYTKTGAQVEHVNADMSSRKRSKMHVDSKIDTHTGAECEVYSSKNMQGESTDAKNNTYSIVQNEKNDKNETVSKDMSAKSWAEKMNAGLGKLKIGTVHYMKKSTDIHEHVDMHTHEDVHVHTHETLDVKEDTDTSICVDVEKSEIVLDKKKKKDKKKDKVENPSIHSKVENTAETHDIQNDSKNVDVEKVSKKAKKGVSEKIDDKHTHAHAHAKESKHKNVKEHTVNEDIEVGREGASDTVIVPVDACLPLKYVQISTRPKGMQEQRLQLPVCGMEQEIIEAMRTHDIIVVCAETGSGKSTQCPQFAYEAGYANNGLMIGITQPRRVAAVSTAERVAYEMGVTCGGEHSPVAFHIRYDNTGVGADTKIKFMTDGILLRELCSDLLLRKYGVIFLDEAHERGLNTDILLGLLSRAVPLRRKFAEEAWAKKKKGTAIEDGESTPLTPLKVVIMSATLGVKELAENPRLFPDRSKIVPVVQVPSRQFPVTIHFSKRTELHDYLEACYNKVCKIHVKLPPGAILLFLPGRREILHMCRRLRERFAPKDIKKRGYKRDRLAEPQEEMNIQSAESTTVDDSLLFREKDDEETEINAVFESDDEQDSDAEKDSDQDNDDADESGGPVYVLPLYAMLTREEQAKVFAEPPEGHRLIVVATNVAETSLTIPGVRYVVDCGRAKERRLEHGSGISKLQVTWISQASADQRSGRAGRVCAGHCYRLYSSAVYTQRLSKENLPEVCTRSLEDVVLQMKAMGIDDVNTFPFPTPPEPKGLQSASMLLSNLGAIKPNTGTSTTSNHGGGMISDLGKALALLPIGPRFSKMLLLAKQAGILEYGVALVAMLSERDPFLRNNNDDDKTHEDGSAHTHAHDTEGLSAEEKKKLGAARRALRWHKYGDTFAMLRASGAYAYAIKGGKDINSAIPFCTKMALHAPTMDRSLQLRRQLIRLAQTKLQMIRPDGDTSETSDSMALPPPTSKQEQALRQALVSGLLDCVAKRAPPGVVGGADVGNREAKGWRRSCAYLSCSGSVSVPLYISKKSALYSEDPKELPEWICYVSLEGKGGTKSDDFSSFDSGDTSAFSTDGLGSFAFMQCVTVIEPSWLSPLAIGTSLIHMGDVLDSPTPYYDADKHKVMGYAQTKYGIHKWSLGPSRVPIIDVGGAELEVMWFARLLLEGKVEPLLSGLSLVDPAHTITKGQHSKKAVLLLRELRNSGVTSLPALYKTLTKNPNFMKESILLWIRDSSTKNTDICKENFGKVWTKIVKKGKSSTL